MRGHSRYALGLAGMLFVLSLQAGVGVDAPEWGASVEAVVEHGPGELVLRGERRVVRHAEVAGIPMTVNYRFDGDQLWQVRYFSRARHDDEPARYLEDYRHFRTALAARFGEPDDVVEEWTDELLVERPEYHGQAVQVGHLALAAGWAHEDALILLTLEDESFRPVQQAILTAPDVDRP